MLNILTTIDGAVGTIAINRRERFNSLDVETARDLRKAGLQMARDEKIRAVVLRGAGGVFCSGADLKDIRDASPAYGDAFQEILEYIHSTISEIRRAPKPFVAAVDGIAAAGGFGLAMSCDLVLASDRAAFEWAYSKTGLTGAESSTFLLPRLIGLRRSFELLYLNPRITADAALQMGLVTAVCPAATFDRDVQTLAASLAAGPTAAWGVAKELMNQAAGMDRLDFHLDRELDELRRIADGGDFAEGIDAFFARRQPRFGAK